MEHSSYCKEFPGAEELQDLDFKPEIEMPGKGKKNDYKFTEEMSNRLVEARLSMDSFFKRKSTDNSELWLKVLQKIGIEESCSISTARKRWDNCRTRWRNWKSPGTGAGNEGNRRAKSKQPIYVQMIDDWMEESHCSNPAKMVDTEAQEMPSYGTKTGNVSLSQSSSSSSSKLLDEDGEESAFEWIEIESEGSTEKNQKDLSFGLSASQQPRKKRRAAQSKPDALIQIAMRHDERNEMFQQKILDELAEMRSLMKFFIDKNGKTPAASSIFSEQCQDRVITDYTNIDHTLNLR